MKLSGVSASTYFDKPNPKHYGILIFGANTMRIALARQKLITALIGKNAQEEMRLTRIQGTDLRKDQTIARDAIKEIGFFPGPRVVFIEEATDSNAAAIEQALQSWVAGDATLLITAGQLNTRSKLRKLLQESQHTVSIGIYNDPPTTQEINQTIAQSGLSHFNTTAKEDLITLGRNLEPGDFHQTLEKLSLYKYNDNSPITVADIENCAPISIDTNIDEALHLIAEGQTDQIFPILKRLFGQGVNPTTVCIAASRHFRMLQTAMSHPNGLAYGLSKAQPPVFGVRRDRMIRQARRWNAIQLDKAINLLIDADLQLRSSSKAPAIASIERIFIRLSMLS